jgi:hypothetical protein
MAARGWTQEEIEDYELRERAGLALLSILGQFSNEAFYFAADASEKNPYLTKEEIRALAQAFDARQKNRFRIEHEDGSQWHMVDTADPNRILGGGYHEEMQLFADELNAMTPRELEDFLDRGHWPANLRVENGQRV